MNSRSQFRLNQVWRRRVCKKCQAVFTTLEAVDYSGVWAVEDAHGKWQPFQKQRLFISIYKSLEHRSTAIIDAEALTNTSITKLQAGTASGQLSTEQIMITVHKILQRFDTAAAVHYQAFHQFKSDQSRN